MGVSRLAPAVLALALLAAGAAAATAPPEYEILYSERTATFDSDGTLAEGGAKAFKFVVSQPNVTRIDFVLTWRETGDTMRVSAPDRFALEVVAPSGATTPPSERSDDGELRVRADGLNRMPSGGPASAAEVDERLAEGTGTNGMGEWRATVRLEDVGNPEGASVDDGNDYHLEVVLRFYEGVPMRVVTLSKPTAAANLSASEQTWGWAAAALCLLALALGATLVAQQRRRRSLSRAAVTDPASVSPGGDTATASKR